MLSTDCSYCGTVNQIADEVCVVCGGNLPVRSPFVAENHPHEWQPRADPNRPVPGIRPFGMDTVLRDTLSIFTRNLWLITKIVVVIVAPLQIFRALNVPDTSDDWELRSWSFLLGAAADVLVAPALIYALMKVLETRETPGVQESYRWGINKLVKLSICALITGVLTALGYMLCIIPGIIVMLSLALVYPVAVLEDGSVSETLSRSRDLTKGHRWEILIASFLLGIIMIVPALVATFLAAAGLNLPLTIAGAVAGDILGQLQTVMALVMYLSLSQVSTVGHSDNLTVLSLNK
jgi:hypothetical protein